MKKPKFGYGWLIKWILAAILIAAGILMKIYDEEVVYATTGIAIVIFSLLRVIPLLKTLKKEVLRTINLIEIIFDTIMGGVMVYVVFSGKATEAFWLGLYGYLLAVFFYARGLIFFLSLFYWGEKSEGMKFWFHIVCLTIGTAIFVLAVQAVDIISTLGWIVLFISVGGAVYLGVDGFGGYRKYRENSKALNETKEKKKKAPVEKGLPQPIPEEKEEKETYIN
ncbi:MAG: hypothetical protein WC466_01585 [Candidatus Izemoplasmatales bacterium]|jgi:hypothetical protein